MNPKYPIYIISKSRWESRLTSKALEKMNVPYHIIVESQEYDNYASVIDKKKILILPQEYKDNYDTFWKDDDKRTGSGPARNYVWDHSIENGHKCHWLLDDNINSFRRLHHNLKIKVGSGTIFKCAEDFTERYENVAISGFNYDYFCKGEDQLPPYVPNTRIYSCLFIRNDIPYRWRGRYNEDTDLSLRVLKDGLCTIQFNAFLQDKTPTQQMGGGNTDELYQEGTHNKSQMLVDMHPDVTTLVHKFNRIHHHVNYRPFKKNKLIRKKDYTIRQKIDNYGMILSTL